MRIRHYTPGDFRTVLEIFQRAVHEGCAAYLTPEQLAAWAPHPPDVMRWTVELALGLVWVCDDEAGRPVGFVHVGRDGLLRHLYVDPRCGRSGVASRLLQTALNWAREECLDALRTHAYETSRPFFERHGFRMEMDDESSERDRSGKSPPIEVMLKPLATTTSTR